MFYREAGDFKTSYQEDSQTFPIKFDRTRYYVVLVIAIAIVPVFINDYYVNAVFLPFLIYSIAAIGLNILTGYCGQVSLGTGGFMAVGAYACYKLMTGFPDVNILAFCLACRRYGSRDFIWLWPPLRRNFSLSGCSTGCRGSTTTLPLARSAPPNGRCLDTLLPVQMRIRRLDICSVWSLLCCSHGWPAT
jgi:hypothetical protein